MQATTSTPKTLESGKLSPLTSHRLLEHAQSAAAPPTGLPPAIEALWWDTHGDPTRALQIAEGDNGLNAVWVRAYLRRRMGDESIASYWYAKAIRPVATGSTVSERELILKVLIGEI